MATLEDPVPSFIKRKVRATDGRIFEIVGPLNDYRSCHDGTPQEARIVFVCKEITPASPGEEFVLKVKVQLPAQGQSPAEGPSTTTVAELKALDIFQKARTPYAPWLVAFYRESQDETGPLPGGFITYTIMTKLPGVSLFGRFWKLEPKQRDEIVPKAVEALRAIYDLGVEPGDRGMRNVMWDPDGKHCGIVDFEL